MGFAAELAGRINSLRYEDLPAEAIRWAKIAVMDTAGVALAGSQEACSRIAERAAGAAGGQGPCTLIGRAGRAGALAAALINGTSAHALDFDDMNTPMGGHPSAPLAAALFALGEEIGADGRAFLLAFVAGFETECRIGRGVHYHHYEKGWHPTSTLGTFGAAAACGRLLGLSDAQMETALAISASLASGVKANFGTMTKPLHVGHCARSGLLAARLAKEGFTACPEAFEHKQGFFEVFNGTGTYDPARILARWADPLEIVHPGPGLKPYPCCGSTQPSIDALLGILRENALAPEAVRGVEALLHPRRLPHVDRPDPRTGLDAKFSIHYILAQALLSGGIRLEHFEGEAHRAPRVREVMRRVRAAPHPDFERELKNPFAAVVTVTTVDGRTVSKKDDHPLGRGPENPLPEEALRAKFENCAARALPPENVPRLYESLMNLEAAGDLREVAALMAGAGAALVS